MISTLVSIFVLGLLVIVHELGHFLVARASGVRVLRFSIGFGPRLFAWTRAHTEYAVSAIPLGGYVKMAGEEPVQETGDRRQERGDGGQGGGEPWEYRAKPVGTRAAIVLAGPLVNYLAALVSLWVVFVIGYPELLPVIGGIEPGTPAQAASLEVGDRVHSVNGHPVESWEGMARLIQASAGVPVALVVERGEEPGLRLTLTPASKTVRDPLGRERTVGLIGVSPSGAFRTVRVGPARAVSRTLAQHAQWVAQTGMALWLMVTGKLSMRESVAGPIGIFYLTAEAMRLGISPLLHLVSLLSLSLAIFNLLPVPILDGGHLLFLAIERLRGRAVSLRVQERSTQVGFALLMALILVACLNDLSRFGITQRVAEWFR